MYSLALTADVPHPRISAGLKTFLGSPLKAKTQDFAESGLVRRAQTGDLTAFEALYRNHVGAVFAVCLRMLTDRSAAEDATQEAFARAWEKLGTFRHGSAFATWLHRLAVNVVLGRLRQEKGWREHETQPMEPPAAERLGNRQPAGLTIDLERAISDLPVRARSVLVLFDIHGYTHSEIGEMLEISTGGSKAQLHRARQLLRGALGGVENETQSRDPQPLEPETRAPESQNPKRQDDETEVSQ